MDIGGDEDEVPSCIGGKVLTPGRSADCGSVGVVGDDDNPACKDGEGDERVDIRV